METSFKIKVSQFEGPLDLLLGLIEKKKMHVSEVSMASVADEYVNYLKGNDAMHMGETANFLLTAATIILIKSANLLPKLNILPEEKADMEELEERLTVYQKIKGLGLLLKRRYNGNRIFWPEKKNTPHFSPYRLEAAKIRSAYQELMAALPKEETLEIVHVRKTVSLETIIRGLSERIQTSLATSFKEFTRGKIERVEIILSFLAMLELARRGSIEVNQNNNFEDIYIKTNQYETPRYY